MEIVFSCKDGALWEHNVDSVPRCDFFGKQYPFSISYYVNDNPHLEKKFLNMSIDGNMPVDVDIKTHSDVSYRTGMQTKIPKRLFVKRKDYFIQVF